LLGSIAFDGMMDMFYTTFSDLVTVPACRKNGMPLTTDPIRYMRDSRDTGLRNTMYMYDTPAKCLRCYSIVCRDSDIGVGGEGEVDGTAAWRTLGY